MIVFDANLFDVRPWNFINDVYEESFYLAISDNIQFCCNFYSKLFIFGMNYGFEFKLSSNTFSFENYCYEYSQCEMIFYILLTRKERFVKKKINWFNILWFTKFHLFSKLQNNLIDSLKNDLFEYNIFTHNDFKSNHIIKF